MPLPWILPSPNRALAGSMPALCAMAARSFSQASYSAEPEVAAPNDQPEPDVGGNSLSPSSMRTCAGGRPSISAAICVRMV